MFKVEFGIEEPDQGESEGVTCGARAKSESKGAAKSALYRVEVVDSPKAIYYVLYWQLVFAISVRWL